MRGTFVPIMHFDAASIAMLTALLGTSISPFLFFWQAAQEREDIQAKPQDQPLKQEPQQAPEQLSRIKLDTYTGMAVSQLVAWCIMVTAAAVLPVRVKVNTPGLGPISEAVAVVAATVTVGRLLVAEPSVTAKTRRPSGHCASASTHWEPLLVGVKVKLVP